MDMAGTPRHDDGEPPPVEDDAAADATEAKATPDGSAEDTIAGRTRTRLSLVDVTIDALEADLPDAHMALDLGADELEYQRFLASLLPQEEENLDFLDEEDEEYHPDEDDEEDDRENGGAAEDDDRHRARISKKELTDLLWDSTRTKLSMPFPTNKHARRKPGAIAPARTIASAGDAGTANRPATDTSDGPTPPLPMPIRRHKHGVERTMSLVELRGSVSQEQCIKLASQMHKHFQLLLQSYHMMTSVTLNHPQAEKLKSECQAMLDELQGRGARAQQCKGALLSKLTPAVSTTTQGGGKSTAPEDQLELRRVTRSLTAAHAAVAHPSMFEIVGSQALEELTAKFQRQCSVDDRNKHIQDQMLELDKHLLLKTKRNPKKPFTHAEDNLLAHGAKRYGIRASSWKHIEKHFLPGKSPELLSRRYKYLAGNKTGNNAVKVLHEHFHTRRDVTWLLEEDLRVVRGLLEFPGDSKRFARISADLLPHRTRLEIRKRWERIQLRFLSESDLASEFQSTGSTPDDSSVEYVTAVKEDLEQRMRQQLHDRINKQEEVEESDELSTDTDASVEDQPPQAKPPLTVPHFPMMPHFPMVPPMATAQVPISVEKKPAVSSMTSKEVESKPPANNTSSTSVGQAMTESCKQKILHPALFFSSWAIISPATLLSETCEHNWPSFIDKKARKMPTPTTHAPSAVSTVPPTSQTRNTRFDTATNLVSSSAVTKNSHTEQPGGDTEVGTAGKDSEEEDSEGDSDYEHDCVYPPVKKSAPAPSMRHSLRLENLVQPGNERTQRALAALERRIMGQRVAQAPNHALSERPRPFMRRITVTPMTAEAARKQGHNLMGSFSVAAADASSSSDEFECEELLGSSDEELEVENEEDDDDDDSDADGEHGRLHTAVRLLPPRTSLEVSYNSASLSLPPTKRLKPTPSCATCGASSRCICSSERMQQLMRRIQAREST
ncbi:TPA: hypothetical protein N0F65_008546 [Lagenidium giganteum]|uniref:Myb-like domain-containing protein n=1 Tax=Lagenidium giganteum TaxID=4803 RepID=A0AAV2YLG4_9STRA|nr:TPA: hypothetical protein N0F65_008546 [Lagenidium giganteum]